MGIKVGGDHGILVCYLLYNRVTVVNNKPSISKELEEGILKVLTTDRCLRKIL